MEKERKRYVVEYAMRYLGFFLLSKLHSSLKAEHSSVSPSRSYGLAKLLNFCRLIRKKYMSLFVTILPSRKFWLYEMGMLKYRSKLYSKPRMFRLLQKICKRKNIHIECPKIIQIYLIVIITVSRKLKLFVCLAIFN